MKLLKIVFLALLMAPGVQAAAAPPQRIADAWFAHNAMLIMLGATDHVVATVAKPGALPWMFRVAPALGRAESIDGSTMNAEELLRLHADLVFVSAADPSANALTQAGLNVVKVGFNDIDSFLACLDLTAKTLGTPLAAARADAYRTYLKQTLDDVRAHLPADRPTVLHVNSLNPLKVDGDHTIIDQWIVAAGGRNVAAGLTGNMQPVSVEQILAWHPDVVIIAAGAGDIDASPQASLWKQLTAVKEQRVYRNPMGVFPWDRYGPELPLQVRWAAEVIHGRNVDEADLTTRTRAFYKTFYGYELNEVDALRILRAQSPEVPVQTH